MKDVLYTFNLPYQLQLVCNVSNPTQDLKWSNKMLLQFGGARNSHIFGRQQDLVPNLKPHNPMVLVIVSLLSLLYVL